MNRNLRISVVIPALNEAEALPLVLADIPRGLVDEVIVVDNGSTDGTADVALDHGALAVHEPHRGYGSACLAGVRASKNADIIIFMDGDYSDDPFEIPCLLEPLLTGQADMTIGSRIMGTREKGALLPQVRLGNALAALLIRLLFKKTVTDLGPFRAITAEALHLLNPTDKGYGFPMQTQVRAIIRNIRIIEVPVSYRRRIGRSKISGTFSGTILAGSAIISTILKEFLTRKEGWKP